MNRTVYVSPAVIITLERPSPAIQTTIVFGLPPYDTQTNGPITWALIDGTPTLHLYDYQSDEDEKR